MSIATDETPISLETGKLRVSADLGRRMLTERLDRSMTQTEAAIAAGVTRNTYFQWEAKGRNPSLQSFKNFDRLAQFYGVRTEWLLRGTGPRERDDDGGSGSD